MSDVLVVDIETIPQQTPLSLKQKELYKKLMYSHIKRLDKTTLTFSEIKEIRRLIMSTNAYLCEIIVIGLFRNRDGQTGSQSLIGLEQNILEEFWKIVSKFSGQLVTFNGLEFDIPIIIKRSMKHRIIPTNNNILDLKRYSKYPHFDVKLIIGNWDKYANGNLDFLCDFLNIESPKEGKIKASGVEQAFLNGQIKDIAEYCERDVISTYNLYMICKDYVFQPSFRN